MLNLVTEAWKSPPPRMVILIVDDDELVRGVLMELLEDLGFAVIEARSGHDALALLRDKVEVGLVISDINMPEMDGLQLVEELKSMRPSLPVILMSGRPYKGRTHLFLSKPFARQQLLACIAEATMPLACAPEHGVSPSQHGG